MSECYITPAAVISNISTLKASKTNGDTGFNSNHSIWQSLIYTQLSVKKLTINRICTEIFRL